jgi:hypothetical protein
MVMIVLIVRHTIVIVRTVLIVHLTIVITRIALRARLTTAKMVVIVLIVRRTIVKKAVIVLTVHASIVREVIVRLIIVRNVLIIIIEKKALGEEETLILADLGRVIVLLTGNRLMEVMTVNVAPGFLQEVLHTDVRKEE